MFRQNALKKISTPEELTKNIQITNYPYWVLLMFIIVLLSGLIVWSYTAELSNRIKGVGIFLPYGGRIVDVPAPYTNLLKTILVSVGDYVEKGDDIAVFLSVEREKQLRTADENLKLDQELSDKVRESIFKARQQREVDNQRNVKNLESEMVSTRQALIDAERVYTNSQALFEQQLITQTTLSNKRLTYNNLRNEVHAIENRMNRIVQAESEKRSQEDLRLTELEQSVTRRQRQKVIAVSNIDSLKVAAPVSGEVVEIKASEGALLSAGSPFLSIITNTKKRNFTSIRMAEGNINEDSTPLLNLVQTSQRNKIEYIAYVDAANGKKIRPGMELQIEIDYLGRNEYGMLLGQVLSVSEFPITAAGIESKLANRALVNKFTRQGALFEVRVQLTRDQSSKNGFAWTSPKGAEEDAISVGSLGQVEFIRSKEKPITKVLPLLKYLVN